MKRLETQSTLGTRSARGHEHASGHSRATSKTGARRCRSKPDRHERQDDAATGRPVIRSAASRGEPGRVIRRRRLDARRRRTLWRHCLYRGTAHE